MTDLAPAISGEHERAAFRSFQESTAQDWAIIARNAPETQRRVAEHALMLLRALDSDHGGFPVSRLQHSLQTAARAENGGESEEYVMCALLHDIGDTIAPSHHPVIAADMLRGIVSEGHRWMVEHHGIFQGYNFFHHVGMDRNMRDRFRGHPHFDRTAEFIELYDNPAFDPAAETLPLPEFEPMVRRLFAVPRNTVYQAALDAMRSKG
jgi:predicted HD phosphohydrolase